MSRDLVSIVVSAALATFNPSLLAAVTVMLLLPRAKRLMLGYLLGAYVTSIGVGLAVVFALNGSGAVNTSRHIIGPGGDILIGAVALAISLVLATGRDAPVRNWRARRRQRKAERGGEDSWQQRMLGRGSARVTFVVGAVLSFPGVSYLNALHHIVELNPGVVPAILLVVFFCAMQQLLIELPLLSYAIAPVATPAAVGRFRAWLTRTGRRIAVVGLTAIGVLLIARGVLSLGG